MRQLLAGLFVAFVVFALPMTALAGDPPGGRGGRTNTIKPSSPVPEPMAMAAFAAGAVVVGLAIRRQRRRD